MTDNQLKKHFKIYDRLTKQRQEIDDNLHAHFLIKSTPLLNEGKFDDARILINNEFKGESLRKWDLIRLIREKENEK